MNAFEVIMDDMIDRLLTIEHPSNMTSKNVQVKKLDEYKNDYAKLEPGFNARITLALATQRFGTEREPTNILLGRGDQNTNIYFTLGIASGELYTDRTDTGVYQLLYDTIRILIGMETRAGGYISAFQSEIFGFEENIWYYQTIVCVADLPITPYIAYDWTPQYGDAILKKVDFNNHINEFGNGLTPSN